MKKFYYPNKETDQIVWLEVNFLAAIDYYLTQPNYACGISLDDLADLRLVVVGLIAEKKAALTARNAAKMATSSRNSAEDEGMPAIYAANARIKAGTNYTEAMGIRFGIIGEEDTFDYRRCKPILEAKKVAGEWFLEFSLQGHLDEVIVSLKRPGETEFSVYNMLDESPHKFAEPMLNGIQFKAVYRRNHELVGLEGPVLTVEV